MKKHTRADQKLERVNNIFKIISSLLFIGKAVVKRKNEIRENTSDLYPMLTYNSIHCNPIVGITTNSKSDKTAMQIITTDNYFYTIR